MIDWYIDMVMVKYDFWLWMIKARGRGTAAFRTRTHARVCLFPFLLVLTKIDSLILILWK